MEAQAQTTFTKKTLSSIGPPSERYLSIARICDKLSRKKSWVYDKLKNDPTFPRPIRLGSWPVLVESRIDEWVLLQAASAPPARKPHMRFGRKDAREIGLIGSEAGVTS